MRAEDVVALYALLEQHGVLVWVDGGWGIDALLGQQTRPHKDFDVLVALGDVLALTEVLAARGFRVKELWSENRWVDHPVAVKLIGRASAADHDVATAFVLVNGQGHELDVHVLTVDEHGFGIPAWQADLHYSPEALAGGRHWEHAGALFVGSDADAHTYRLRATSQRPSGSAVVARALRNRLRG